VDVFAGLADPVRRAMLRRLVAGPARVVDLAADQPVSRPAVSRHLRLLTEAGLVRADDRGRERHYRLCPEALEPVRELLAELGGPADRAGGAEPGGAVVPADRASRAEPGGAPVPEAALDALDTEVRRTVRDRRRPTEFEETA
jgi:DNA-binding transcriptional ArsR family regulator